MTTPDILRDLPAPAKLNLFLHLVGQRADGYHLIRSVFVPIEWADALTLSARQDGQIALRIADGDAPTANPQQDLVFRAAAALQAAAGVRLGVDIELTKRVPTGAGLGGGSSDAATTLIGLNRLWGLGLTRRELAPLALSLGADVPFFLGSGPAFVQGVGEHLTPLPATHRLAQARSWAVLKPPAAVATAAVFRHPDLPRPWLKEAREPSQESAATAILEGFAADRLGLLEVRNDLQGVAQSLEPMVSEGLDWLQSHGLLSARMSGSGSAVFAEVPSGRQAALRQARLPGPGWILKVCSSLSEHPLAGWLSD